MMTAWLCVMFAEVVVVAIIVEIEVVRFELARFRCVDEAPETTNTRWVAVGAASRTLRLTSVVCAMILGWQAV